MLLACISMSISDKQFMKPLPGTHTETEDSVRQHWKWPLNIYLFYSFSKYIWLILAWSVVLLKYCIEPFWFPYQLSGRVWVHLWLKGWGVFHFSCFTVQQPLLSKQSYHTKKGISWIRCAWSCTFSALPGQSIVAVRQLLVSIFLCMKLNLPVSTGYLSKDTKFSTWYVVTYQGEKNRLTKVLEHSAC